MSGGRGGGVASSGDGGASSGGGACFAAWNSELPQRRCFARPWTGTTTTRAPASGAPRPTTATAMTSSPAGTTRASSCWASGGRSRSRSRSPRCSWSRRRAFCRRSTRRPRRRSRRRWRPRRPSASRSSRSSRFSRSRRCTPQRCAAPGRPLPAANLRNAPAREPPQGPEAAGSAAGDRERALAVRAVELLLSEGREARLGHPHGRRHRKLRARLVRRPNVEA